jgi:hypothetical protein
MTPLNRRYVKRSKRACDLSLLFRYSPLTSPEASPHKSRVFDSKNSVSTSNSANCGRRSFQRKVRSKKVVDGNNLNRDSMTPNTIIITRANLIGHGEVPFVESTGMGPVMYCQYVIEEGEVSVHALLADEDSVAVNNPEFIGFLEPRVKRLEVGAEGRVPLIDHDFESGEELKVNGERVYSIFVHGGVNDTIDSREITLPTLVVVFRDRPSITEYQVGYIRFECKPSGNEGGYFQVFQCPGHHHDY